MLAAIPAGQGAGAVERRVEFFPQDRESDLIESEDAVGIVGGKRDVVHAQGGPAKPAAEVISGCDDIDQVLVGTLVVLQVVVVRDRIDDPVGNSQRRAT